MVRQLLVRDLNEVRDAAVWIGQEWYRQGA